jgi:hypothetical protein
MQISSRDHGTVNQLRLTIHANVQLQPKVQLITLLRLAHIEIKRLIPLLDRTGNC